MYAQSVALFANESVPQQSPSCRPREVNATSSTSTDTSSTSIRTPLDCTTISEIEHLRMQIKALKESVASTYQRGVLFGIASSGR